MKKIFLLASTSKVSIVYALAVGIEHHAYLEPSCLLGRGSVVGEY